MNQNHVGLSAEQSREARSSTAAQWCSACSAVREPCSIYQCRISPEYLARERLIAAAPAMLAMLQAAVKFYEDLGVTQPWTKDARAVITKATGAA